MLTGSVPYSAGTAIAVAIQHLQAPIPSLPIELNHLQPIIDRVMAKDPEERFNTLEELIVTLDKISVDTSIAQKNEIIGPAHKVELAAPTPTQTQTDIAHLRRHCWRRNCARGLYIISRVVPIQHRRRRRNQWFST